MININELSGVTIKNALKASRVRMSYHNKHRDGSGNFGFVIVFEKEGVKDVGCGMTMPNESWYQISGIYTGQKQVYGCTFGKYSRPISRIPSEWNLRQLFNYMNRFITQHEEPAKFVVS